MSENETTKTPITINREDFKISEFMEGGLILICDKSDYATEYVDEMDSSLVFASGNPPQEKQRAILEFILKAVNEYKG